MKRILITGKDSYIGTSVEKWLLKSPEKYQVYTLDVKGEEWKNHDFSRYDVVFHVAGIAHIKETKKNKDLYYKVNRDLAYEVAVKSKESKIKQFIFLSSMSVYGLDEGVINKQTKPNPKSAYGKSKFEAENLISNLKDQILKIVILRPPIVYGKNCKGNYKLLEKIAKSMPIFPDIKNERSMIFIDNLSELIKLIIDNESNGLFLPQNKDYVNTSEMVKMISESYNIPIKMTTAFNSILNFFGDIPKIKKAFGSLVYDISLSEYINEYSLIDMRTSVILSRQDGNKS